MPVQSENGSCTADEWDGDVLGRREAHKSGAARLTQAHLVP